MNKELALSDHVNVCQSIFYFGKAQQLMIMWKMYIYIYLYLLT